MYKKFILKNLIFILILFLSLFVFNFVVDPYKANNYFELPLNKEHVSYRKHYRLYKMLEHMNNPKEILILGDSRGDSLRAEYFETYKNNISNLSYGGGTLYEAINSFWFATKYIDVKKVIFVLPFSIFNENENRDLTVEALDMINSGYQLYLNPLVTKVSFLNILDYFKSIDIEKPSESKEDFWISELDAAKNYYMYYVYPKKLFAQLKSMSQYCKTNDIDLIFVIPPVHVDLQYKINEFKLNDEYKKFKLDLQHLGKVIDYDTVNSITINKDNFNDPWHAHAEVEKQIAIDVERELD